MDCAVCSAPMQNLRRPWLMHCLDCGFLASALEPRIEASGLVDEDHRETALEPLRRANFERVLDRLIGLGAKRGELLLDVGCAHGWFLEAAAKRGFLSAGLEPDAAIAAKTAARGLEVRQGLFPQALDPAERFQILTFNDVFEHLPDSDAAMAACMRHLAPGGLLVLNLPNANGLFYRLAVLADRLGIGQPLDRLWQIQFPSPHLTYFTPPLLARLARRHGLAEIHRSELPSVSLEGLWSRMRADPHASRLSLAFYVLAVSVLMPLSRILPSDSTLQIFRKD